MNSKSVETDTECHEQELLLASSSSVIAQSKHFLFVSTATHNFLTIATGAYVYTLDACNVFTQRYAPVPHFPVSAHSF